MADNNWVITSQYCLAHLDGDKLVVIESLQWWFCHWGSTLISHLVVPPLVSCCHPASLSLDGHATALPSLCKHREPIGWPHTCVCKPLSHLVAVMSTWRETATAKRNREKGSVLKNETQVEVSRVFGQSLSSTLAIWCKDFIHPLVNLLHGCDSLSTVPPPPQPRGEDNMAQQPADAAAGRDWAI